MASLRHTHTYQLYKAKSGGKNYERTPIVERTFRCAHPHCTHFAEAEFVLGKASICNECGVEFILTKDDLRRVKPKCVMCSETKKGKATQAATSIIGDLLKNMEDRELADMEREFDD